MTNGLRLKSDAHVRGCARQGMIINCSRPPRLEHKTIWHTMDNLRAEFMPLLCFSDWTNQKLTTLVSARKLMAWTGR